MLKALLQGRWLGHPLHPMLVHLPIGLFLLCLVLDLLSWASADGRTWERAAFYVLGVGLLGAVVAALPGLADYGNIRADHPARKVAQRHLVLNLLAVGALAASWGVRWRMGEASATPLLPLLISLLGVAVLSYSGYLGGILVYDDGIAVGRHRRQGMSLEATRVVSAADSADGYVSVVADGALADGERLRVEVDGVVMVVARMPGRWLAFQEFCTHRYGPLSEGELREEAGQVRVVCPWHRSCFDACSGAVMNGPAKQSLRTFPVRVEGGMVQVKAS